MPRISKEEQRFQEDIRNGERSHIYTEGAQIPAWGGLGEYRADFDVINERDSATLNIRAHAFGFRSPDLSTHLSVRVTSHQLRTLAADLVRMADAMEEE